MATHTYGLNAWRIGKYKGVILKTASTREVLAKQGRVLKFPANNSDTYVSRRYLPYGATSGSPNTFFDTTTAVDRGAAIVNAHLTTEGVTSTPDALTPQDVTSYMYQYDCLYSFTDKTAQLGEDDIPEAMAKIIANRVALVNEMRIFGILKAAAEACGWPLLYDPKPNWSSYDSALGFANQLMRQLSDLGPRDMIDIHSFMWGIRPLTLTHNSG